MKNCNIILTEKQQKPQHYKQDKLKYEYLTGQEILLSSQGKLI